MLRNDLLPTGAGYGAIMLWQLCYVFIYTGMDESA
jgi:hypothetical protein